eukprot:g44800.t1
MELDRIKFFLLVKEPRTRGSLYEVATNKSNKQFVRMRNLLLGVVEPAADHELDPELQQGEEEIAAVPELGNDSQKEEEHKANSA